MRKKRATISYSLNTWKGKGATKDGFRQDNDVLITVVEDGLKELMGLPYIDCGETL